ncbi:MAG TPA: hypothetical protein VI583_12040 [Cyclobacteriaceae bacterium]|nr:hypothetical protein [Cyclobacteriaceae bacterium]
MNIQFSRYIKRLLAGGIIIAIILAGLAWLRTLNKIELEFRIQLNHDLIRLSAYGEPPTFAIWLENSSGNYSNVYVTRRAFESDWEGKPAVPVALPYWFHFDKSGKFTSSFLGTDAVSGATPKEEYFITRVQVSPDSVYKCWIEMNLSGDYNEYYKEADPEKMTADEFGNGQPALVYCGIIKARLGAATIPEIIGMSLVPDSTETIIQQISGITTANKVFRSIEVIAIRPKPKIL